MKASNLYLFIIVSLLLVSCDCEYSLTGIVINAKTNKPVEGVVVVPMATDGSPIGEPESTDRAGVYNMRGVTRNCDGFAVKLIKRGYQKQIHQEADTIKLVPVMAPLMSSLQLAEAFVIEGVTLTVDEAQSEASLDCDEWHLTANLIKKVLRAGRPIDGAEWHHLFDHLPCNYTGQLIQNDLVYDWSINGGSWMSISAADTTFLFGNFDEKFEHFFLSPVWVEEEEIE